MHKKDRAKEIKKLAARGAASQATGENKPLPAKKTRKKNGKATLPRI